MKVLTARRRQQLLVLEPPLREDRPLEAPRLRLFPPSVLRLRHARDHVDAAGSIWVVQHHCPGLGAGLRMILLLPTLRPPSEVDDAHLAREDDSLLGLWQFFGTSQTDRRCLRQRGRRSPRQKAEPVVDLQHHPHLLRRQHPLADPAPGAVLLKSCRLLEIVQGQVRPDRSSLPGVLYLDRLPRLANPAGRSCLQEGPFSVHFQIPGPLGLSLLPLFDDQRLHERRKLIDVQRAVSVAVRPRDEGHGLPRRGVEAEVAHRGAELGGLDGAGAVRVDGSEGGVDGFALLGGDEEGPLLRGGADLPQQLRRTRGAALLVSAAVRSRVRHDEAVGVDGGGVAHEVQA
mmetsp:Transcript_15189/g.38605  ORF Transcript_15189/g.38605 Transcript_15189/m.38605 type:complete len:344 (+) Transcript_15189:969-2000(+)